MTAEENSTFSIRSAAPSDSEVIVDYNMRLAAETEDTILDRRTVLLGVQGALTDSAKCLYFLAESDDGEVVGQAMVTYEWSDWRNGNQWWFQSVYVREEWRGRGVFRALFERILEEGKRQGAVGFRLYAVDTNDPALATYERLGMKRTHYVVLEREG